MPSSQPGGAKMLGLIGELATQLRESYAVARSSSLPAFDGLQQVMVCGMGGSAAAAEVCAGALAAGRFPLRIIRAYAPDIPSGPSTLHVFSSYSGNTEETLSCFRHVREHAPEAPALVLSSGGTLSDEARAAGISVLPLPPGLPPRASLGHGVGLLCGILEQTGFVDGVEAQVEAAAAVLDRGVRRFGLDGDPAEESSLEAWVTALAGRLPVLYAGGSVSIAAMRRLRAQLNENAKMLAATAELPELDHNEIVGWGALTAIRPEAVVVALRDPGEHPRVKRRFEVTRAVLAGQVGDWLEYRAAAGPPLARVFELIQWGDTLSVLLAEAHEVDPMPVVAIDTLKRRLADS